MGKGSIGKNGKNCATCQFWDGQRTIVNSMISYESEKAACYQNSYAGGQTSPTQSCNKWQKWINII